DGDGVGAEVAFGKLEVGSDYAVDFGMVSILAFLNQRLDVLGHDAKHGQAEVVLDVFDGLDAGVEILNEERQREADDKPCNDAHHDVFVDVRADGRERRGGRIEHLDVGARQENFHTLLGNPQL